MWKRKVIGLFLLVMCVALVLPAIAGDFAMAGFHTGAVLLTGLLGLLFTIV